MSTIQHVTNVRNANHPRFHFLDDIDIDQDVKDRLSISLSRIYSGNSDVYETPLAKKHGAERILSEWHKIFQGNREIMNDVLIELEELQVGKVGPRSISVPWTERVKTTELYFEDTEKDYSLLDATPTRTRDKGFLRPLSISNAAKFLKNDTNSGLPHYTRKSKVKERLINNFDYYIKRRDPCILFTRTQEQGKTRDVWGYPMADTLNEMLYYRPLLDYQRKLFWRSALHGPDSVSRQLTSIIKEARSQKLSLVSLDFSSYDRSIKAGLQHKVGEYYKYLFQSRFTDDIEYIIERKSTIGLLTPDGIMEGKHGEPSGSTLTNEDDSIAQFIIARHSNVVQPGLFSIQGDDGVYAIKDDEVDLLFQTFKSFGIEVNDEKSYKSKNYLVYLQNLFHTDYEVKGVINGIYPTFRALNRLLFQERWSNFEDYDIAGKDYYAIRAISILENCKHHPLFEKLVRFVLKYDKYGLQASRKSISQYCNMLRDTSGIEGVIVNQYGDDIKGIRGFATYKLINKYSA